MLRLSEQYLRYGSCRIRVFLGRERLENDKKACQRLWAQHGLQVPKKRPWRRTAGSRLRPLATEAAILVLSYDFIYDACANCHQLKRLTVVEEYTREARPLTRPAPSGRRE
jgi:putative transposase